MALADSIWWTRKARIEAERRLLFNATQFQFLLFWYSFCSVSASIFYLRFDPENEYSAVAWLILSILVLSASGLVAALRLKERAALIKECYETLQGLHERITNRSVEAADAEAEYRQILAMCENHASRDYFSAMCNTYLTDTSRGGASLATDRTPNKFIWCMFFLSRIRTGLIFLFLYSIPLLLFLLDDVAYVFDGTVQ